MLTVCLVQSSSQSFQSLRCNLNSPFLPHSFIPPSKCGYWSMSCQSLFVLEYDPSGCVWVIFMFLLICLQCFWGLSKSTCLQILLLVAEHTSVSQANTVHAETTESLHPPYLMCLYAHTAIFMIREHGALVLFELRLCYSRGDWINVIGVSMQWTRKKKKKKSVGLYGVIDRKRLFHMTSTQELGLHMKSNADSITDRWFCRVARLQENRKFTRDR